jgi:hypothetical protein
MWNSVKTGCRDRSNRNFFKTYSIAIKAQVVRKRGTSHSENDVNQTH